MNNQRIHNYVLVYDRCTDGGVCAVRCSLPAVPVWMSSYSNHKRVTHETKHVDGLSLGGGLYFVVCTVGRIYLGRWIG